MKFILSCFTALLLAASIPSAEAVSNGLYGSWRTQAHIQGFDFDQTITIQKNNVTSRTTCSRGGYSGVQRVQYPVKIGSGSLHFLRGSDGSLQLGPYSCRIYQNPGPVHYSLRGNELWLWADGPARLYRRVK